ncbi:MAG TPA: TIGR03564 family F420-dependent LLM class oxidoreductase [Chloroflexia bacterium]|nr:TIGR03564 family F420-dependent LLM class oxidoreductase [Chloroflexia bacterium]
MLLGTASGQETKLADLIAQAQQAEQAGFASGWFANIFGVDAMTAAALCGGATTRLELGTAVVPTYPRHPVAMAQQALSTQAAAGGRFLLGIGPSHQPVIEGIFGLSYARPLAHMREYLAVLAPLIEQGTVAFQGSEFRVAATLTVPGATPCPILISALGPQMLALAGRACAGTITAWTGPRTLRDHIVPHLQEAAAQAGRPAPRVVAMLPVAVTSDVAGGRARISRGAQIYGMLPSYRAMLEREGVAEPGDVAILGDADAVGEQLAQLAASGVTDFIWAPTPLGADREAGLAATRAVVLHAQA